MAFAVSALPTGTKSFERQGTAPNQSLGANSDRKSLSTFAELALGADPARRKPHIAKSSRRRAARTECAPARDSGAQKPMMEKVSRLEVRLPEDFPDWRFDYLDIGYEEPTRSFWMEYKATAPHYFPLEMFMEIVAVRRSLLRLIESDEDGRWPIRYFVIASRRPGVFGLGGGPRRFRRCSPRAASQGFARARRDLRRHHAWPRHRLRLADRHALGGAWVVPGRRF